MPDHMGFLEIECDAPPYPIVHACRKLDLSEPEDVRWCRKGRHSRRHHSWIQSLTGPIWERLLGRGEPEEPMCVCGRPLPILECYCFTFQSGERVEYEVGQCPRCRTIHWERLP
jgi:hypothetical protein